MALTFKGKREKESEQDKGGDRKFAVENDTNLIVSFTLEKHRDGEGPESNSECTATPENKDVHNDKTNEMKESDYPELTTKRTAYISSTKPMKIRKKDVRSKSTSSRIPEEFPRTEMISSSGCTIVTEKLEDSAECKNSKEDLTFLGTISNDNIKTHIPYACKSDIQASAKLESPLEYNESVFVLSKGTSSITCNSEEGIDEEEFANNCSSDVDSLQIQSSAESVQAEVSGRAIVVENIQNSIDCQGVQGITKVQLDNDVEYQRSSEHELGYAFEKGTIEERNVQRISQYPGDSSEYAKEPVEGEAYGSMSQRICKKDVDIRIMEDEEELAINKINMDQMSTGDSYDSNVNNKRHTESHSMESKQKDQLPSKIGITMDHTVTENVHGIMSKMTAKNKSHSKTDVLGSGSNDSHLPNRTDVNTELPAPEDAKKIDKSTEHSETGVLGSENDDNGPSNRTDVTTEYIENRTVETTTIDNNANVETGKTKFLSFVDNPTEKVDEEVVSHCRENTDSVFIITSSQVYENGSNPGDLDSIMVKQRVPDGHFDGVHYMEDAGRDSIVKCEDSTGNFKVEEQTVYKTKELKGNFSAQNFTEVNKVVDGIRHSDCVAGTSNQTSNIDKKKLIDGKVLLIEKCTVSKTTYGSVNEVEICIDRVQDDVTQNSQHESRPVGSSDQENADVGHEENVQKSIDPVLVKQLPSRELFESRQYVVTSSERGPVSPAEDDIKKEEVPPSKEITDKEETEVPDDVERCSDIADVMVSQDDVDESMMKGTIKRENERYKTGTGKDNDNAEMVIGMRENSPTWLDTDSIISDETHRNEEGNGEINTSEVSITVIGGDEKRGVTIDDYDKEGVSNVKIDGGDDKNESDITIRQEVHEMDVIGAVVGREDDMRHIAMTGQDDGGNFVSDFMIGGEDVRVGTDVRTESDQQLSADTQRPNAGSESQGAQNEQKVIADITDSQLCALDWDDYNTQSLLESEETNPAMTDATNIVRSLTKELSSLNMMILKHKREYENEKRKQRQQIRQQKAKACGALNQ